MTLITAQWSLIKPEPRPRPGAVPLDETTNTCGQPLAYGSVRHPLTKHSAPHWGKFLPVISPPHRHTSRPIISPPTSGTTPREGRLPVPIKRPRGPPFPGTYWSSPFSLSQTPRHLYFHLPAPSTSRNGLDLGAAEALGLTGCTQRQSEDFFLSPPPLNPKAPSPQLKFV